MGTWTFPWSQLLKLSIGLTSLDFANSNELEIFLLQLRNVEELRITVLSHIIVHSDVLSACLPVRLPRLKQLEISLSISWILSYFETPSLQYLSVYHSFDAHDYEGKLESLVHRSSCRIRHLTLEECEVHVAHDIMEELVSVEELCIKETSDMVPRNSMPSLVQDIASGGIYLPNLRVLQLPCCPGHFKQVIPAASRLFQTPVTHPLERLVITVKWDDCCCGFCDIYEESRVIDEALEEICRLPSLSVISLNNGPWNRALTFRTVVASALVIDLTVYYRRGRIGYTYYSEESRRHYDILESKRKPVNSTTVE